MTLSRGLLLNVAKQLGGAQPSVTTLKDWSRYKNDGTFGAGATAPTWSQEPSGQWILSYDGTDTITCGNNPVLNFTTEPFSIELWAKITDGTHDCFLFNRGHYNTVGYGLYWDHSINSLSLRTSQAGVCQDSKTSVNSFPLYSWIHCFATRQGTGLSSVKLYINGVDRTSFPSNHIDPVTSNYNVEIGSWKLAGDAYNLIGNICKVRVYNYKVNPYYIRARFHSTKWIFGVAS